MISHTDELLLDYVRTNPPLFLFDPLSVRKVMDLIAEMRPAGEMRSVYSGKVFSSC